MGAPTRPFVRYDGKPYLVVNFDLEPVDDRPLPELLDGLLAHHDPHDILLLRPLTKREVKLLREYQWELETEAWAHIVVKEEDRFRGR
jgi:hypothetical protein